MSENGQTGRAGRAIHGGVIGMDADVCFRALAARDARFDGFFYVCVETTGIYCRPVCPARTPRRDRCSFFRTAAEAERAGFRACFRCRPELAPGTGDDGVAPRLVTEAVRLIDRGWMNERSVDSLAERLGVSGRHLRRRMESTLGVTPVELAQTRRLALAKQLLHDTRLPLADVAFASGFGSVRRFNAAFRARFARSPLEIRRTHGDSGAPRSVSLRLDFRPPFDWDALLEFLRARAIPGVEEVTADEYRRTVGRGAHGGWVAVRRDPRRDALRADVALPLAGSLMEVRARLRALFDLDARPRAIAAHLARDARLAPSIARSPGLRVPGAFDGFETAVRAVLGQQVSVAAATTLAGRFAARFGQRVRTPYPALVTAFPEAARVAAADAREIARVGLPAARAASVRLLAAALAAGRLRLEPGADPESSMAALVEIPGIGPWTAQYLAMRSLAWPDAFPSGDLGIRRALGGAPASDAERLSESWRPWRAYAALHLWRTLHGNDDDRLPPRTAHARSGGHAARRNPARRSATGARRG